MTETQYEKVPVKENEKEKIDITDEYGYGVRHLQAFLFFMTLALGYISRGHLGVTIVAMTNSPPKTDIRNISIYFNKTIDLNTKNVFESINNETLNDEDMSDLPFQNSSKKIIYGNKTKIIQNDNTSENEDMINNIWNIYRTYNWPKSTQEMVQGAFFLGYFIMMFPTGLVVQRWGGKIPLQIALFITGVISIAMPWLTAWGGWKVICACRLLQGFSQAGIYPAIHTLLANWVPVSERGTLSSYVYTGSGFGTIVAFQLGGVLADSRWGWPSTFWLTGAMCLIGFTVLTIFGANNPSEYNNISEKEKNYIYGYSKRDDTRKGKTPWKKILTSKITWACFSGHIGSAVTFIFFLTQVPTYLHNILHFNIKNSGLLSSLPYICTFFSTILFGHVSDFCTNRNILSIKNARIISNTIGGVGTAMCLGIVSLVQSSSLAVFLLTAMLTFHGAGHFGWMLNYIDLAPNYSGALMATGNTLCNSMISILPLIVSSIVTDVKDSLQWRIMFVIMAGISFTANAFYVLFMSTDIQSWNDSEENDGAEDVKLEENPEKQ